MKHHINFYFFIFLFSFLPPHKNSSHTFFSVNFCTHPPTPQSLLIPHSRPSLLHSSFCLVHTSIQCTVSPPPPRMSVTVLPLPPLQATKVWLWGISATQMEWWVVQEVSFLDLLTSNLQTTAWPCRGASSCRVLEQPTVWLRRGGWLVTITSTTKRPEQPTPGRATPDRPASASRHQGWLRVRMVRRQNEASSLAQHLKEFNNNIKLMVV